MLIKGKFKSEFVDPAKFKKDLLKSYVSKFFVEELRTYYTEKERASFVKKQNPNKYIKPCTTGDSNICPKTLAEYNLAPDKQKFYAFNKVNILSNIKFYHFYKNDARPWHVLDQKRYLPTTKSPQAGSRGRSDSRAARVSLMLKDEDMIAKPDEIDHKDLLIERQPHDCLYAIDYRVKNDTIEKKKEDLKSDYRLVHSGLIEIALDKLKPARSRDYIPALKFKQDYFSGSPKYQVDQDDEDLDYLLRSVVNSYNEDYTRRMSTTQGMHESDNNARPNLDNDADMLDEDQHGSSIDSAAESEEEKDDNVDNEQECKKISIIGAGKKKQIGEQAGGLLGITEYDSEDEEHMPARRAFSFVESNFDKYNILNFIEDQESKAANN